MEIDCIGLLDRTGVGTFRVAPDGTILDCNEACASMLGWESRSELLADGRFPYLNESDRLMIMSAVETLETVHGLEVSMRRKDGTFAWVCQSVTRIEGDEGPVMVGTMMDVTEQRTAAERFEYQAQHDPMTGLAGRTLFMDQARASLARTRRRHGSAAMVFIDIDDLVSINEQHGRAAGDTVITETATRIQEIVRDEDLVGRFGSDEFLVLLADTEDEGIALSVGQRIIDSLTLPILVNGSELSISASAGISFFPSDSTDCDILVERAGTAMYRAKETGSSKIRMFEEARNERAFERAFLLNALHKALDAGEFSVRYQPQIDIRTGSIRSLEVKILWNHEIFGLVGSDTFLPLADKLDLSTKISEWAVTQAGEQLSHWIEQGLRLPRIAINLSSRQMDDVEIPIRLAATLEERGLDSSMFQVEIAERTLCARASAMMMTSAFSELGFRVAIDDFGTGGCSMRDLKHLEIDSLKIDRSFIDDISESTEDAAIVDGLITTGRGLGLNVAATGVRNKKQMMLLRNLECTLMQGDYLGKPVPAIELGELLRMQH